MNIKSMSSEKWESVLCDKGKFITQSNKIPRSLDSTEHNDIFHVKIGLRQMKIRTPEKLIVGLDI